LAGFLIELPIGFVWHKVTAPMDEGHLGSGFRVRLFVQIHSFDKSVMVPSSKMARGLPFRRTRVGAFGKLQNIIGDSVSSIFDELENNDTTQPLAIFCTISFAVGAGAKERIPRLLLIQYTGTPWSPSIVVSIRFDGAEVTIRSAKRS
jgi:hypothetical protein